MHAEAHRAIELIELEWHKLEWHRTPRRFPISPTCTHPRSRPRVPTDHQGKPSVYDEIVQMITDKISSDKGVDQRDKNKMKLLAEF